LSGHSGISKNSNRHILLICNGAIRTFPFEKGVGFESCAVLLVVEALLFAPIANVCLEDLVAFHLVFVAMMGGDGGGKRML
jgi:hypothetical protein